MANVNIWDGVRYSGKFVGGNNIYTQTDAIYAVISLVEGHEYLVKYTVIGNRLRAATFKNNPTTNNEQGVRSVYSNDIPTVGIEFSFTAKSNENYLMVYFGTESGGANTAEIIVYDLTAPAPDEKKYLIKNYTSDGYELLTIDTEGALQTVTTLEITAETFQTYGFDELPASDLLVTLSKFDVMLWHSNAEELPALTAAITATPPAQTIVTDLIDISDKTILGVESITATATGNPLFALSFDGKQTWEAWTGSAWETLDSDVSGMTGDMMASIVVDQWAAKIAGLTGFHLKFILHDSDAVESVIVDFKN